VGDYPLLLAKVLEAKEGGQAEHEIAEFAKDSGKGVSGIGGAVLKAPMDITHNVARGFHNLPKMYGDETVRPLEKVTDVQSGLQAAGKVILPFSISRFFRIAFVLSCVDTIVEFWLRSLGWRLWPRYTAYERGTRRRLDGRPGRSRKRGRWCRFQACR
jgi:hypothetical protein